MSDRLRILVADDDALTLRLVGDTLIKHGHEAVTVTDGGEALEYALDNDIDVLITDIIMPGVEGIELISEIINHKPNIRIIAMSGEGSVGYTSFLEMAKTVGARTVLEKPFKRTDLIAALNLVLSGQH